MKNNLKFILSISTICLLCACGGGSGSIQEGSAHIAYDAAGNRSIVIDRAEGKAGDVAAKWMTLLADSAPGVTAPEPGAQAVGLPTVAFLYDINTPSYADKQGEIIVGKLVLNWTGPNGVDHSQAYRANGSLTGAASKTSDIQVKFASLLVR